METIYDNILKMFTGHDELRPYLDSPFMHGDEIIATDAHKMVMIDKKLTGLRYNEVSDGLRKSLIGVLDNLEGTPINKTITVELVKLLFAKFPEKEIMQDDRTKCEECEGEGEIECHVCGNEYSCPKCHGEGHIGVAKPTGKFEKDYDQRISIHGIVFNTKFIKLLVDIADMINCDSIIHVSGEAFKGNIFTIGGLRILIMPMDAPPRYHLD